VGFLETLKPEERARKTVGGTLEVFQTAGGEGYEVRLDERVLVKSSYDLMHAGKRSGLEPWIMSSLGPVKPFDEVLVVGWRAPGNACDGYGFTLVGINSDGTSSMGDIAYCGGPEPVFDATPTRVTVTIPEHPPNRGDGTIPKQVWVFEKGRVRRVR
jgi:hypothetical protein